MRTGSRVQSKDARQPDTGRGRLLSMAMSVPWSTQQLAEFLAVVSAIETPEAAARAIVERTAEGLDAEVAAIVSGGEVLASVGYPVGAVPVAELAAVTPDVDGELSVPGLGVCSATAVRLEHPPGATLVVARHEAGLALREASLLRGIAHASAITMRMLCLLDDERAARAESAQRQRLLERLAHEQAALRRVATLVARGAAPEELFAAVTAEVGRVLDADHTSLDPVRPGRCAGPLSVRGPAPASPAPDRRREQSAPSVGGTWPPWCSRRAGRRGSTTTPTPRARPPNSPTRGASARRSACRSASRGGCGAS